MKNLITVLPTAGASRAGSPPGVTGGRGGALAAPGNKAWYRFATSAEGTFLSSGDAWRAGLPGQPISLDAELPRIQMATRNLSTNAHVVFSTPGVRSWSPPD